MTKSENLGVIEARGVCKAYRTGAGDVPVLHGIDIHLSAGESLSIQGQSGSGKTTLLNILTLLDRPDAGEVLWRGERVDNLSNRKIARNRGEFLGLIFQQHSLIPELNVVENVLMPRRILGRLTKEHAERAEGLLDLVGMGHRRKYLVTKLSGGEMQRVAIARALMNEPSVIIADEPTGSLDEQTAGGVMDMLLDACRAEGKALVLVTHNPQFAELTEKQVFLKQGRID